MRVCISGNYLLHRMASSCSGSYLLEQLSLNGQDRSTASQLITGTSDTTVGFFLRRISGVGAQEWDRGQLCVV